VQGDRLGPAEERQGRRRDLGQLLRADLLPEAWIAPPDVRQLRALLRHRGALVRLRTLLRNRIHAIVAAYGHDRPGGCWSPGPGLARLPGTAGGPREVIDDDLALIDAAESIIGRVDWEIHQRARCDPRVKVLTQLPGVGPFTALVILAEIGNVSRFGSARKLASWAGPTSAVRGSDRIAHYGHISTQGSAWLRWVLCQAAQTAKRHPQFAATFQAIARRRGQEDRHHGGRPQAAHPRLAPPRRRPARRNPAARHSTRAPDGDAVTRPRRGSPGPGELVEHPEPATPRSKN
jgi:transposase